MSSFSMNFHVFNITKIIFLLLFHTLVFLEGPIMYILNIFYLSSTTITFLNLLLFLFYLKFFSFNLLNLNIHFLQYVLTVSLNYISISEFFLFLIPSWLLLPFLFYSNSHFSCLIIFKWLITHQIFYFL